MFGLIQNINYILISAVIQTIEMNLLFFVFKHTARQKHDTQNKTKKSKYIVSISMPFKTGDITQENHGDTGMFLDGYLATKLSGLTFT